VAHPTRFLRDLVHQRVRLGILVALASGNLSFTTLRDMLGQPDSGMHRHLAVLTEAGLVSSEKVIEDNRQKTWISLTSTGRDALDAELSGLRDVIAGVSAKADDDGSALTFAALLGDRTTSPPLDGPVPAELVIDTAPAGFEILRDLPIDEKFQLAGVSDWGKAESQRLAYRSHGLRGGHVRSWVYRRPDKNEPVASVHVMLVELGNDEGPQAIIDCFAPSTLADAYGVPDVHSYLMHLGGQLPVAAVCWFARGRYLVCVTGRGDDVTARGLCRHTSKEQYERLSVPEFS
jgi:DNA-binding MarR family transcriptional regulator